MNKFINSGVGMASNGVTISGDDSNPDNFRFHLDKAQGDTEKGICGYAELLCVKQHINSAVQYMIENHREFVMNAIEKHNDGKVPFKTPKSIFESDDPEDFDVSKSVVIKSRAFQGEFDEIVISHDGIVSFDSDSGDLIYPNKEIGNAKISIDKWQGSSEKGEQGFIRLLALKDAVDHASKMVSMSFDGAQKEALIVAGIGISGKRKESDLTM